VYLLCADEIPEGVIPKDAFVIYQVGSMPVVPVPVCSTPVGATCAR